MLFHPHPKPIINPSKEKIRCLEMIPSFLTCRSESTSLSSFSLLSTFFLHLPSNSLSLSFLFPLSFPSHFLSSLVGQKEKKLKVHVDPWPAPAFNSLVKGWGSKKMQHGKGKGESRPLLLPFPFQSSFAQFHRFPPSLPLPLSLSLSLFHFLYEC